MTAPARGVVARRAPASYSRVIKDDFDPAAHADGGFRLLGSDRLNRLHYHLAEHREHVCLKRAFPGSEALRRFPASLMRLEVTPGAFLECHLLGGLELRAGFGGPPRLDRVYPVEPQAGS